MKLPDFRFGGRHGRSRAVIYAASAIVGLASGLIVVAYRFAISSLETLRLDYLPQVARNIPLLAAWLAAAAIAGLATARMVDRSPLIRGSGIPQVKALLLRRVSFDWKRELPFKFLGGALALGTGLSLGREGPSIQLGALAGEAVQDVMGAHDSKRFLVTAGAAAGISAAFNAPLAGVIFCIEELHRNFSPVMLTSTLIASFVSNAVMWIFFGNHKVFDLAFTTVLPLRYYFSGVALLGVVAGVLGVAFNAGILGFQRLYKRLIPSNAMRIVTAFAAAAAISLMLEAVTGGGSALVDDTLKGRYALPALGGLLAAKLVFTLFSYASGSPGGIFLPVLAIGALLGGMGHALFASGGDFLVNYLLLGMAGFFVAVVRAPVTGAVLITEMSGNFAHFPAFIFVSVTASLVAGALGSKPIYESLLGQIEPMVTREKEKYAATLHIPVFDGSPYATCEEFTAALPPRCLLSGIGRGEEILFPEPGLSLECGDEALVVVDRSEAAMLKSKLLGMGKADESHVECES